MKMKAVKDNGKWTIWDGIAFESDMPTFATKQQAAQYAAQVNSENKALDNIPACDAPHLDNY